MVGDLTNDDMLRMMANENMDSGSMPFTVTMEVVRAVVEAFAAKKISLPLPKTSEDKDWGKARCAPSFVPRGFSRDEKEEVETFQLPLYTCDSLGDYLGWDTSKGGKVDVVLRALMLIELKALPAKELEGQGSRNAREIIKNASNAYRIR